MNNEGLKPEKIEEKKIENNQESLLLERISELEEQKRKLEEENKGLKEAVKNLMNDELTGLKRRVFFIEKSKQDLSSVTSPEKLETEQKERKEGFKSISFLFCDIDHFKTVNDEYGHDFGDEILKDVARIIKKNVREGDTVCRWGGEEIAISLLGAGEKEAVEIVEKLRKSIKDEVAEKYGADSKYSELKVSLSVGVSSFEPDVSFDDLIKRADKALYLAKETRDNVKTHSDFLEAEKSEKEKK